MGSLVCLAFEKSRLENADKRGGTQQWDICLKKGGRYLLSFNYDSEIFLGAVVTANTDSLGKTYFLKGNDAYSNKEVEFSDSGNYTITLTSIFTGGLPSVRSLRLFPLEGQPLPVEGDATRIKEQYDNAEEQLSIYTHDTKLKKRLLAYAAKHPELCQQTDDDGQGGLWFEIDKRRISIRLTAPYSEERRRKSSEYAKSHRTLENQR